MTASLRRIAIFFALVFVLMPTVAAQAQADSGYYFEQNSDRCGDFAPIEPSFGSSSHRGWDYINLDFVITEQQIAGWECSGSHFDIYIDLAGFSPSVDWSECSVTNGHEFTMDSVLLPGRGGTAAVVVSGAKLTGDRMYPGDVYSVELDCPELAFSRHGTPTATVNYAGAWYSTDPDGEEGYELTEFRTKGTNGPANLPIYVKYTGQNATLFNSNEERKLPLFP